MSNAIDAYIDAAPADQRSALTEIRAMIRKALPKAEEVMGSSRFPVFTINGEWIAGFASRKKGPMLYVMVGEVVARHAGALGKHVTGNSCIEWRESKDLSLDSLRSVASKMLAEAARSST